MENLTARRCTATSQSTGQRCGRAPILGGSVCSLHGGRAPQAIAAAKLRLLEGVEPAIARLIQFIVSPPGLCNACGRCDDTSAIVSAIRTVLDRCGLGPTATMQVVEKPDERYADLTEDELIAALEALLASARASRDLKRDSVERYLFPVVAADPLLLDAYEVPEGDDARSTPFEDVAKRASNA